MAFKRDLVVLDCQPPSKMRTKASPISAILLPCRYTVDTSSLLETVVLDMCQSVLFLMATFISFSILRMVSVVKCTWWTGETAGQATLAASAAPSSLPHNWFSTRSVLLSSSRKGQSAARSSASVKTAICSAVKVTVIMVGCVDELSIGQGGVSGCRLGPLRQLAHGRRCSDGSAARMDARHQQSHSRCDCADDLHP